MISKRIVPHLLLAVPLMLHAATGHACRMAPAGQLISVNKLMQSASGIAVGLVIGATPLDGRDVEYRFLLLDQLAGHPEKVFTVLGSAGTGSANETTFNDHTDFIFWARGGGRVMNSADCIIHPGFAIGSSYLVFLGSPVTRRSFEKIAMVNGTLDPDDQWLKYVKKQLAERAALYGKADPVAQQGERDYERIGRFIYRFHRVLARDGLDRKTLAGRHAPNQLLLRVGLLADEFDHIVGSDNVPDAEIDATLAEAVAVEKILTAWSSTSGSGDQ